MSETQSNQSYPQKRQDLKNNRKNLENQLGKELINDEITKYGKEVLEPINATLAMSGLSMINIESIRYGLFTYCENSATFHDAETPTKIEIVVSGLELITQKLIVEKINKLLETGGGSINQVSLKGLSPEIRQKLLLITDAQLKPGEKTLKIAETLAKFRSVV